MKNNNPVITILVAVVFGAVGFFGGMQYQKSQTSTNGSRTVLFQRGQGGQLQGQVQGRFGNGTRTGTNGGNFMRPVIGKIISTDNNSITVQMQDGSSKIAVLSDKTTYENTTQASKSDLKDGDTVAVIGATNSDGSVTAESVQINPRYGRTGGGMNGTPPAQNQ